MCLYILLACLLILSFGIIFQILIRTRDSQNGVSPLPPGPKGFPFLGFMPFMAINPPKMLTFLGRIYGSIFTLFLGNYRIIVLNDYASIKEAFKEDVFSGRPDLKMLAVRNGGIHKGLVCSEGKEWAEQRKFTMRHLKDLGFGKQTMECLVQEEVEEFCKELRKELGKPVSLQSRFNTAVLNGIWRITCGERYDYGDVRLQNIIEKTGADLAETQYTGPVLFLPWLINSAPRLTRWNTFVNSVNSVHSFLVSIIAEHKATLDPYNPRDFIDTYLSEVQRTTDPSSSFFGAAGEHSLLVVLLDLFMAGADTTSTTLSWAFLFMILNEKVQSKVQEELDSVLGQTAPCVQHRKKLPYTEATIMEILRKSSLVPMGLFHSTMADTQFRGHHIPKDSVVIANLYNVHNSKTCWGDPENFRPERFLTEDNHIKKLDGFMPFSTGKRACPGESIARDELFLFFARLLQQFTFRAHPNWRKPSQSPKIGVILSPRPYKIIVAERPQFQSKQI